METPHDPILQRELGVAFYKETEYDSALVALDQATARRRQDARGFFYLGATHEKKKEYNQAIQAYSRYSVVRGSRKERRLMEMRLASLQLMALRMDFQRRIAFEDTLKSVEYVKGTVAVAPFAGDKLPQNQRNIGRGLAVLIMTDLGTIEGLTIVDRFRVNVLLDEIGLTAPVTQQRPDEAWEQPSTVAGIKQRLAFLPKRGAGAPYFGGTVNDEADTAYADAVREFQSDHGLVADGVVGPKTRSEIEGAVNERMSHLAASSAAAGAPMAPRIGKFLRASTVISGSLLPLADQNVRIDAAASSATNPTPTGVASRGELEQLFRMEKDVVIDLAGTMNLNLSEEQKARIRKSRAPATMKAFLEFCDGLDLEAKGQFEEAAAAFRRALEQDPGFREAAEAAQLNQELATAGALVDPELVFSPPPDYDQLGERLTATAEELNSSEMGTESEDTETRLVGIGLPPGPPQ